MTQPAGTVKDGELWLRCPECGDSVTNPHKAHFSVNLNSGLYHCLRCNASGKLSPRQFLEIQSWTSEGYYQELSTFTDAGDLEPDMDELPLPLPGAGTARPSALKRGHVVEYDQEGNTITWDAFEMRDLDGTVTGYMLRRPGRSKGQGTRGWGFAGPVFPLSSPGFPLRIVEGPYDVLYPGDVCVFGTINAKALKSLIGHTIILCPDGDVWLKRDLLRNFLRIIRNMLDRPNLYPYLAGVEFIPLGKDPDQVPPEERELFPRNELPQLIRTLTKEM